MLKPLAHFACCLVLLLIACSAVSAQVIEADHPAFGPSSITRDTAQGLDFLDLTESLNRSFNDVSSEFGVGGDFEGFRYATVAEVATLINNFGFSPTVPSTLPIFASAATPSDSLSGLVDMLGVTLASSAGPLTQGLTGEPGIVGPFLGGPVVLVIHDVTSPSPDAVFDFFGTGGGKSPVSIDSGTGSFLVMTTPVPEPGSLALFAVVCGMEVLVRRRKQLHSNH